MTQAQVQKKPCSHPCHLFDHTIEQNKGGSGNIFVWKVDLEGFPIANINIGLHGKANQDYNIQVRHHHPSATIGPTITFTTHSEAGQLNAGGFEIVRFEGIRPVLPEIEVIVTSSSGDLDTVSASLYATIA